MEFNSNNYYPSQMGPQAPPIHYQHQPQQQHLLQSQQQTSRPTLLMQQHPFHNQPNHHIQQQQQQQQQQQPSHPSHLMQHALHHHSPNHLHSPNHHVQQQHNRNFMSPNGLHMPQQSVGLTSYGPPQPAYGPPTQTHYGPAANHHPVQQPQPPLNHIHHRPPSISPHVHAHVSPSLPPMTQQQIQYERVSPFYQNIPQTEFRIIELNKRLQSRPKFRRPISPLPTADASGESYWWEQFGRDFFDDDATLTIRIAPELEYTIGRTLIPRFFRSYFLGGIVDLSIKIRNARDTTFPNSILLDCDQTDVISKYIYRNMNIVIHTEGHLSLEFVSYDTLLIKSWKFYTHQCYEYIDRTLTNNMFPTSYLHEPVTKYGLTTATISFLKMCMIMEPMQELMFLSRENGQDPKTCLRRLLSNKFKQDKSVEEKPPPTKRRKRKAPANPNGPGSKRSKANANTDGTSVNNNSNNINSVSLPNVQVPNLSLATQDVMAVGEPLMLGADFGDDNERRITQLENNQFDSSINDNGDLNVRTIKQNQMPDKVDSAIQSNIDNHLQQQTVMQATNPISGSNNHSADISSSDSKMNGNDCVTNNNEIAINDSTSDSFHQSKSNLNEEKVNYAIQTAGCESESKPTEISKISPPSQGESLKIEPFEQTTIEISDKDIRGNNSCSTIFHSENHISAMNSIPEDIEDDSSRAYSCDQSQSKQSTPPICHSDSSKQTPPPSSHSEPSVSKSTPPPTHNSKSTSSTIKQNRRRSSERKETLREGLMRTSDFVVAKKDLKCEHPALWRITTGNNLLQQFKPTPQGGVVLYENTNQYAGWNPEIKKEYVGVDVKLTQHTRNQITVERLLLNFRKLEDADAFYDEHFTVYLQIIISIALDSKFWEGIEKEPQHHDYFLTSRRIIDDITKQFKAKLSNKLKLSDSTLKNIEKYPNLLIKKIDKEADVQEKLCRACNIGLSTHIVTFENRSYDLHSYKPVKVTSETTKTDENSLCEFCLELVQLYSEIHHMGWKLYNLAKDKIEQYRTKNKPINAILDECLKDEDWLTSIYSERDTLWSKVERLD